METDIYAKLFSISVVKTLKHSMPEETCSETALHPQYFYLLKISLSNDFSCSLSV